MSEGALVHTEVSPTAASIGNPLYGPSGSITYAVQMQTAMGGLVAVEVDATSGDEAAIKAHTKMPGSKVLTVAPAEQRKRKAA